MRSDLPLAGVAGRRRLPPFLRGLVALALLGSLHACHDSDTTGPEPSDLLDRLNALPGVTAAETAPQAGYQRAFRIDVTQPVDHDRPQGATFTQRAYLSHVDEDAPMVFGPSGYGASERSSSELAGILQGNGLYVVHRHFPDARPEPFDWQYLNVRQAAADHHRIVHLFRRIYGGPWVSTGGSKGGMTAVFHRRFYPDDVDATVAYVAPFSLALGDERYVTHLASVGTAEERAAIHAFQRRLLEHRDSLLWRYERWFVRNDLDFSLPLGPAFEARVQSYQWGFWQNRRFDYRDIPGRGASYDAWLEHLVVAAWASLDSDQLRAYYNPYYYQALTELGHPAMDTDHLADLLVEEPITVQERFSLPEVLPPYSPSTIQDVLQWLATKGDRIIYIYGGMDPWTGGAVELTGGADALKIVQPEADHRVRIKDLDQRDLVLATLGRWLGFDVTQVPARGLVFPAPRISPDLVVHMIPSPIPETLPSRP